MTTETLEWELVLTRYIQSKCGRYSIGRVYDYVRRAHRHRPSVRIDGSWRHLNADGVHAPGGPSSRMTLAEAKRACELHAALASVEGA